MLFLLKNMADPAKEQRIAEIKTALHGLRKVLEDIKRRALKTWSDAYGRRDAAQIHEIKKTLGLE